VVTDQDEKRGRGILSPSDRAYLTNPVEYINEYSRQSANERKHAIHDRVQNAIHDFTLLLKFLPDSRRKEIFATGGGWYQSTEDLEDALNSGDGADTVRGLEDAIAFLYLAGWDMGENAFHVVEEGVRRGEESRVHGVADVDLTVETSNLERLAGEGREKMERGEELTNAEVRALLETDHVDPDAVAEYIRE